MGEEELEGGIEREEDMVGNGVCGYKSSNGLFPVARHKDFYHGHSWASGLFVQANAKSQESSSEAINAYYSVYLYAKAKFENNHKDSTTAVTSSKSSTSGSGNADRSNPLAIDFYELMQYSRLLLTLEIRATKYYWHMRKPSPALATTATPRKIVTAATTTAAASRTKKERERETVVTRRRKETETQIGTEAKVETKAEVKANADREVEGSPSGIDIYDPIFATNTMVGVVGALDCAINTWFGSEAIYVHGINMMPFTP